VKGPSKTSVAVSKGPARPEAPESKTVSQDRPWKRVKHAIRTITPRSLLYIYRSLSRRDVLSTLAFLARPAGRTSMRQRFSLVLRLYAISEAVPCSHSQGEMLALIGHVLDLPSERNGCLVEAGCYKGGSAAKISLAARLLGRRLVVFDSFEGLPKHRDSPVRNIFGEVVRFPSGGYRGDLEEVKENIRRFGAIEVCEFRKGWFDKTLPKFREPVAVLFLDVDLAGSTRTALKYLYPRLVPQGVMFSHDGHLPPVIRVFQDDAFWREEVGCPRPFVEGLGRKKLLRVVKPAAGGPRGKP
jgi:O-methyltransferase